MAIFSTYVSLPEGIINPLGKSTNFQANSDLNVMF